MQNNWLKAENILENDGVVVLPTDTLYGVIGKALSKKAVERIYKIKGRTESKPFIVLITSFEDIGLFGVKINNEQAKFLEKIWPGKVSVILSCSLAKWRYIHRGEESIAFRMISSKHKNLFNLINKVGPLVAPSANKQGEIPAENITKAKYYFNDEVDLYINGGNKTNKQSTIIKFENNKLIVLRQGAVKINKK
ncbi:MAG: L-threonylcarbamoyladenylate synthase [Candidatus Nomurabacteria bacterium]|nr:L-threonylcarbamoyladenylate synthase [Candidatus Nomurabacteria bacterium]